MKYKGIFNFNLFSFLFRYGITTNGTKLYVTPGSRVEASLAALPGRLIGQVKPERFLRSDNGPAVHQALIKVTPGFIYRAVWAVAVKLVDETRLASSVSDLVYVNRDNQEPLTTPTATNPTIATTAVQRPGNFSQVIVNESDSRMGWILGIVIALIVILVIIAIIIILLCCCWSKFYF